MASLAASFQASIDLLAPPFPSTVFLTKMRSFMSLFMNIVLLSASLAVHPSAAASSKLSFADAVWNDCRAEALNALYSPFVVALAAGNLDNETYAQYIYQDAPYAQAAADANVVALNYAVDPLAKEIFAMFNDSNARGAESFRQWLDEHIPNATYPLNNATINYMNFLNNTAHGIVEGIDEPFTGKIASVLSMAAFIPCWKLYYHIGMQIVAAVGNYSDNPYYDWIYANSKESLKNKLVTIDDVFDTLAADLTVEELAIVEQVHRQGMRCEVEFFLAQPLFQYTSVPLSRELINATGRLLIFYGFDGSSNVVDSSVALADLAVSSASNKTKAKATWGRLFSQYKEEYGLGVENISNSAQAEKFDYYNLSKEFEKFSIIEGANLLRVNRSGALAGIQAKATESAGEDAIILQDFITFFRRLATRRKLNSTANVISTTWSASLVKAVFSSVGLNQLQVHANELAFEGSVSTGGIIDTIVSPADRVSVLEEIVNQYSNQKKLTVYAGESVEELLPLLRADIGIVVGPSSSLKRVGTQLGVTFRSLFSASISVQNGTTPTQRPNWKASPGLLYTVSSWTEIDAFVLGWQNHFDIVGRGAPRKSRMGSYLSNRKMEMGVPIFM
ncbi:bifunctional TH2 protein, mitochondrial-like [Diospyros lotus]|uniref:bifunctional TH2 protein, mitochondrial-like n=1 Tax=Diospyros lotus TaxID=55363 RepID=UPI002255F084|nr:bifunctional TH2 protein, mitochondrial-like [Diospyros lotus]